MQKYEMIYKKSHDVYLENSSMGHASKHKKDEATAEKDKVKLKKKGSSI